MKSLLGIVGKSIVEDITWLLAAFPIMRFLVAKDTQALNRKHQEIREFWNRKDYLTDFD